MEDICEFLSSLVHVHGKSTLKEFLKKNLKNINKKLKIFLEYEIHDLYHTYDKEDCCGCAGLRNRRRKTYLREKQWTRMYEIQKEKCVHCKTKMQKKTICQYGVIEDVTASAFDITLLTTLLLHFKKRFNILDQDIFHIMCISENRDWLAHDEQLTSTVKNVRDKCNDITVSINVLAGSCSAKFARERDLKIRLEKDTYCHYTELQEKFPSHSVSSVKQETRPQICLETNIREWHFDQVQLQEHFKNLRCDKDSITGINGILLSREADGSEVSYDIDQIKTRLSVDEYKRRVLRDIDPSPVIECLHKCGHLIDSERQALIEITDKVECSESFLRTILSKDDQIISYMMKSLLDTEQQSTHDFILGYDPRGKLMLVLTGDIPLEHSASFDIVLKIMIENHPDLLQMVLNYVDKEEKIGDMNISNKETGSVVIHLKPDTPDAYEKFARAYYNGTLRQHIEDYLRKAGVLEKLIKDQVKVVVNISIAGSANAKLDRTIYDKHWDYLIEQLSPKPVVDLLRQKGVLDDNDVKDIFRTQTRFAQSNTLLCKLNIKGSETVTEFKDCLSETSQDYILRKFQESEELPPVELVLTDNSLDASGHDTDTTFTDNSQDTSYHASKTGVDLPFTEKAIVMRFQEDSSFATERNKHPFFNKQMLITDECVNEQKLRILLFDGGTQALRYTVSRIVLDVYLKNIDEKTRLQFGENDKNLLFPSDLSLPSLIGLTNSGLQKVWIKVLQQSPDTSGATLVMIYEYLVSQGLEIQLNTEKPRIQKMQENKLMSQEQWELLYLKPNISFENFDFQLLCFLILKVFQLELTTSVRLFELQDSDVSMDDDISRLECYRNILGQKNSIGIDNENFNTSWTEIRNILIRLIGQCFSDDIQDLYDCPADPAKTVEFKQLREEMKRKDPETDYLQKCELEIAEVCEKQDKDEEKRDIGKSTISYRELSRRFCYLSKVAGLSKKKKIAKLQTRLSEIIHNCETCMNFKDKCVQGGSYEDGTEIGESERDCMVVFKDIDIVTNVQDIPGLHPSTAVFLMEQKGHRPCYVTLRLLRTGCNHRLEPFLENHSGIQYLSSEKTIRYILANMGASIGKHNIQQHGPCVGFYSYQEKRHTSDTVSSMACKSWPPCAIEWILRDRKYGVPNKEIVREVVNTACSVVRKCNDRMGDLEWRISFLLGERILMWALTDVQYHCFMGLKIILKSQLEKDMQDIITSFVVKTILFWEIEEIDPNLWHEEDLLDRITTCLRRLKRCVQERCLSHYFVRDNNLFKDKLCTKDSRSLVSMLSNMVENVIDVCHFCFDTTCTESCFVCQNVPLLINRSGKGFAKWISYQYFDNYPLCEWEHEYQVFNLDENFEMLYTLSNDKVLKSTIMLENVKGFFATRKGILCHRKAMDTYDFQIKSAYLSLAEQFLKLGATTGCPTAKLHLSAFYAKLGHFEKSLRINDQLEDGVFFDIDAQQLIQYREGNLYVNKDILVGNLTDAWPLMCMSFDIEDWRCIHYVMAMECFISTGIPLLDRMTIHPFVFLAFLQFLVFHHFHLTEKLYTALKLMEESIELSTDTKTLSVACNIVGYCYYMVEDDMKALQYFRKSFVKRPSLKNPCLYHCFILFKRYIQSRRLL